MFRYSVIVRSQCNHGCASRSLAIGVVVLVIEQYSIARSCILVPGRRYSCHSIGIIAETDAETALYLCWAISRVMGAEPLDLDLAHNSSRSSSGSSGSPVLNGATGARFVGGATLAGTAVVYFEVCK